MTIPTPQSTNEFLQIGQTPLIKTASIKSAVYKVDFNQAPAQALKGASPLKSTLEKLMEVPGFAERLPLARAEVANKYYSEERESFSFYRLQAGLSQADLASLADTSQSYIARIESGVTDPGTEAIANLAAALKVEEDALFRAIRNQRKSRAKRL